MPHSADERPAPSDETGDDRPGRTESTEPEAARPRSLWAIMGAGRRPDEDTSEAPAAPALETPAGGPATDDESTLNNSDQDEPAKPVFGLWAVMQRAGSAPPLEHSQTERSTDASNTPRPVFEARPDGEEFLELSDLPEAVRTASASRRALAQDETADIEHPIATAASLRPRAPAESTRPSGSSVPTSAAEPADAALEGRSKVPRSSTAMWGLFLSSTAVALAVLAGFPSIWAKLPSCILGFVGATLSYIAIGEIRRSRAPLRGWGMAMSGLVLGCFGLFAGPTVFAPLGQRLQSLLQQEQTRDHLQRIGEALSDYEHETGHYPSGGTVLQQADGEVVEGHGWMTHLLPHLGHQPLYDRIDLQQSFEAPQNRQPLSQIVDEFLVAGASRETVGPGFGPAHFAGVGGVVVTEQGRAHLGVFAPGATVRRDEIEDGLSQTLIAGEIANRYPAWGSPTNWRRVDKGLNQDYSGFGNQAGTGALFLHADGSVRFYGNKTSREILERLSTRDGHDPVSHTQQE